LEMDVSGKSMHASQCSSDVDQLLHRVVRPANDSRAEEQPFDVMAAIDLQSQPNDFIGCETRATNAARFAIDAVRAIVDAVVGEENLEEGNAAAVRRVAVTDSASLCRADALRRPSTPFR